MFVTEQDIERMLRESYQPLFESARLALAAGKRKRITNAAWVASFRDMHIGNFCEIYRGVPENEWVIVPPPHNQLALDRLSVDDLSVFRHRPSMVATITRETNKGGQLEVMHLPMTLSTPELGQVYVVEAFQYAIAGDPMGMLMAQRFLNRYTTIERQSGHYRDVTSIAIDAVKRQRLFVFGPHRMHIAM